MKNVNIKDVEVTEIVEDIKKNKIKNIVLLIIIGIVSLIGFFFWATKIRWDAEIEEYTEILYVGQEEVKVDRLDGFYGEIIEFELKDDLAILMYCESEYGGLCVTGDFNNGFENLWREPSIVINIVILIDLVLLFILLKDKSFGNIKSYVVFSIILLYGFINLSGVIIEVADYYTFVNFISEEELQRNHKGIPHGGFVIRTGETSDGIRHRIEYSLQLDSNPEFTSSVMLAYARACYRLNQEGSYGCKTVYDVAPKYLSLRSYDDLLKSIL